jgi:chromate transport protein ChrA
MRTLKRFESNSGVGKFVTGLRPAVIAFIAAAAYSIAITGKGIADIRGIIIALAAFAILRPHKLDPVLVLLLAGVFGVMAYI